MRPAAPGLPARSRAARRTRSRAAAGDPTAFAALYEQHAPELFRYCRSILRHDEDARDALQSTMAKAFAALQTEQRDLDLRPWLFRIAHNESISLIRRRPGTDELDERAGGPAETVHEAVEVRERLTLLRQDLQDLPERQRGALVMRELSGLSHDEIAAALDTTARAVKQVIYEARRGLSDAAEGRAMACEAVQRTLSDGDGRVVGNRRMRAHLRSCRSCQAFRSALEQRPKDLAALSPFVPLAGLAGTGTVAAGLGAGGSTIGTGGAAAGGSAAAALGGAPTLGGVAAGAGSAALAGAAGAGGTGLGGGLLAAGTAKAAAIAVAAVAVTGGAVAVERTGHDHSAPSSPAAVATGADTPASRGSSPFVGTVSPPPGRPAAVGSAGQPSPGAGSPGSGPAAATGGRGAGAGGATGRGAENATRGRGRGTGNSGANAAAPANRGAGRAGTGRDASGRPATAGRGAGGGAASTGRATGRPAGAGAASSATGSGKGGGTSGRRDAGTPPGSGSASGGAAAGGSSSRGSTSGGGSSAAPGTGASSGNGSGAGRGSGSSAARPSSGAGSTVRPGASAPAPAPPASPSAGRPTGRD